MTEDKPPQDREAFLARPHLGVVSYENGLGYFIKPEDGNDNAIVGFNGIDPNELPENFQVGDKVEFHLDRESQGINASQWTKVEDDIEK